MRVHLEGTKLDGMEGEIAGLNTDRIMEYCESKETKEEEEGKKLGR